jgi:hypothetical protein
MHVLHLDLIGAIYPDARVVHIIRDGRDVARSLRAKHWGPDSIADAAAEWRESVLAGRGADVPGRYVEVRYERLLTDREEEIRRLFAELGLPLTDEVVAAAVAEAEAEVNVDLKDQTVQAGKWRTALSRRDLAAFDRVAGDLIEELGYESSSAAEGRPKGPRLPRRRRRSQAEERPVRWSASTGPVVTDAKTARQALALLEELLEAVADGEVEHAVSLLSPNATVELVEGGERVEASGRAAGERLAALLREDRAPRGRQRRADVFLQPSSVAAFVLYELQDGAEAQRVIVLDAEGEQIARLAIHKAYM